MTVGSALLDEVVQEVVDSVGRRVRLATPLGIGKPSPPRKRTAPAMGRPRFGRC